MPPLYRFDRFELDSERRELRLDGEGVPIQPRPLDLLLYLARNADRVVPRQELLDAVWDGVRVNDEALSFAVHQARRAVGDDGSRQGVIRTVARTGFRFVASLAPKSAPQGDDSGFVGRTDVLEALRQVLVEVEGGARRAVLLGGEAGIGKTRTAERVVEVARSLGFAVFAARCVEAEGAPVFWPWIQILRPIVQALSASDLADALGPGAPELARLLPEIRRFLREPLEDPQSDAKAARFLLFDSVTALVRRAARDRPLLLVIDDLHRADVSSLLLLRDLTRQLAGERVMILATHRDAESARDAVRAERIAQIVREEGTRSLALVGLSAEEVGEFLRVATGYSPSTEVRDDLRERTNGNPFFLHQVVNVLESEGRSHEVEAPRSLRFELPRHSQDAIAHQVAGLPGEVVSLLEVAAVIGREFNPRVLELTTGASSQEVLAGLHAAADARIVRESPENQPQMLFTHVLLRDALYQGVGPERRAQVHLAVGKALLGLEREGGQQADPPTVAHHFLEAARAGVGDVSEAMDIAIQAGRCAEASLAFEEAVGTYDRALQLVGYSRGVDRERRCELLLALGDAYTKSGRRSDARDCFKSVARVAKFEGLPEKLASAALRFAPDFLGIESGVYDEELVDILSDALDVLSPADSSLRARLLGRLAVALHWSLETEVQRRALCRNAIEMASRLGDPETLRYVECARDLALYSIENADRYLLARAEPRLAGQDSAITLLEQLLRMTALLQKGRLEEYDDGIEAYLSLVRESRQPQAEWYGSLFRATRCILVGDFASAVVHAERYRSQGDRVQDRNAFLSWYLQFFLVAVDCGGLERLEDPLKEIANEFPDLLGWHSALALYYSETGRPADAAREIDRVLAMGVESLPRRNDWLGLLVGMGLAAHEIGHKRAATTVERLVEPYSGELLTMGYSSFCWGATSALLGVAAATLGRWEKAEACFREAAETNERIGALPAVARGNYYRARMQIAQGDRRSAAAPIDAAATIAEELGMTRLLRKVKVLGREVVTS